MQTKDLHFFSHRKLYGFFATAFLLALSVRADDYLLVPRTETDPDYPYQASPEDWRDINIYQLFTDRFYDGNSSNNTTNALEINRDGWFVDGHSYPESKNYHHGGDWAGLQQKLDYLDEMGVNAIWISGVQMNAQGRDTRFTPYHQYHPTDFWRCDPVSGTFQELTGLIDDCHRRGIYVILDVVINHMADLGGLPNGDEDSQYWADGNESYTWWGDGRHRGAFNRLDWFHHNGTISNWDTSPENLLGQFKGTDDLATEREDVQAELDLAFKNLISATDCDGFRVDAIKHVDFTWCKQWADDMRTHAASLGKTDFLLFGELFSYDNSALASFCQEDGYSFNSALFFPMSSTIKSVFKDGGNTGQLTTERSNMSQYGEGADRLVAFIDNHDVNRIALEMDGDTADDVTRLKPAMTFLYTALPVPLLYYGTEHCFDQGGHWNNQDGEEDGDHQRECMFDRGFQPGPAAGSKFDEARPPLYSHIAAINAARKNHKSLTRGSFSERWQESSAGAYAYLRKTSDEEALVAFNTASDSRSITPAVDLPDGTEFVNVLSESETLSVSNGVLSFSLDSRESKIFVADATGSLRITSSYHWPLDGEVDAFDSLWINAEALPINGSTNAFTAYSADGGTTWQNAQMTPDESITGSDGWHVNLGTFSAGTVIEYAICVQGDGSEVWANNDHSNYSVTVNAAASAVEWIPAAPDNCFGSTVDVVYTPNGGILGSAETVNLVYGFFFESSTNWTDTAMAPDGTSWSTRVSIPAGSLKMQIAFTDGENNWDNNNSQNWEISLNACAITDSDGDKIPDEWETKYGFSNSNAADAMEDTDGDGIINHHEYIAGTNPTNPASLLTLGHEIHTNGMFRLSWPVADSGRRYTVLRSTNLFSGTFAVVHSNMIGSIPAAEFSDPDTASRTACFYKILAEVTR